MSRLAVICGVVAAFLCGVFSLLFGYFAYSKYCAYLQARGAVESYFVGDYEGALQNVRRALLYNPANTDLKLFEGEILSQQGYYNEAAHAFETILCSEKGNCLALVGKISSELFGRLPVESELVALSGTLAGVSEKLCDNPELSVLFASVEMLKNDHGRAKEFLSKVEQDSILTFRGLLAYYLDSAQVAAAERRYEEGLIFLKKVVQLIPSSKVFVLSGARGQILSDVETLFAIFVCEWLSDEALSGDALKEAVERVKVLLVDMHFMKEKELSLIHNALGLALMRLKEFKTAKLAFIEASKCARRAQDGKLEAMALFNWACALKALAISAESESERRRSLLDAGELFTRVGQGRELEDLLCCKALNNAAVIYCDLKNFARAVQLFELALGKSCAGWVVQFNLSIAYDLWGKREEAIKSYKIVLKCQELPEELRRSVEERLQGIR